LSRADTGLLLFVEDPERMVARWRDPDVAPGPGVDLLRAAHADLADLLAGAEGTVIYLAPAAGEDEPYVRELAREPGLALLEVPPGPTLQRWNSGLSILYNRQAHRKALCVDAGVPDVGLEDIARARRKLDLYRMILGREGEDRCWLVGLNGFEEVLSQADAGPADVLHPLLQAAGRAGLDVSLLDTKRSLALSPDMETLRALARRDDHPRLHEALRRHRLLTAPVTPAGEGR
jgi:hypothetical protein